MKKPQISSSINPYLRLIPSLQELLQHPSLQDDSIEPRYVKIILNSVLQDYRRSIREKKPTHFLTRETVTLQLLQQAKEAIEQLRSFQLKRVINGTGIILHTNLGRAPLAEIARHHLHEILENYCNLEIDLHTGKRGDRITLVEKIICLITGAEAALVVNNNAAAILLVLNSLCRRKEVPVSRGELVEIGGSFRMPEVMKAGQVKMIEVGTTNKTHLKDYEEVISSKTAAILKVHPSNYRVLGFTHSVPVEELAEFAHKNHLPLIYDMGCGVIENLEEWGFPYEPVAREYLNAGVDVMTFSADKVLGGPQAGIIIGKKAYLSTIRKNHLLRALRCDKMTFAALDATLRIYLRPQQLKEKLPVARMLTIAVNELQNRGQRLMNDLKDLPLDLEVVETVSHMGSGALPLEEIPSRALRIRSVNTSVEILAKKLRLTEPAVIGYIENEYFYLNLRTIREDEFPLVVRAFKSIF